MSHIEDELKLYRFVLDSAPDFILWIDSEGVIVYANASLCSRMRYASGDLLNRPISVLDPTWNPINWEEHWKNLLKTGTWRGDLNFRTRDGETVPIDVSANFVHSAGRDLCCAIIKDVSERKSQERRLQEVLRQANQYRFALDQVAIVSISDPSGQITYANEKFCRVSGYSPEEIIGRDHDFLRSDAQLPAHFQELWGKLQTGKIWRGEVSNRSKEGSIYWVDQTIVPFLDEWGAPQQFMAIGYDITEKQIQAQTIKNSEAALQEAQHISKIGSFEFDIANNTLRGSRQMAANYGLPLDMVDFSNVDWSKVVVPEDYTRFNDSIWNSIKTGTPCDIVFRVRRKDDEVAYIHCTATPVFDEFGSATKLIGTNQDVTEQNLREQLLREHEVKLVHASKMSTLGQMAGGVAHEINNPLAIIQGNAAMLMELAHDGDLSSKQVTRSAEKIVQTVERIARIIQGLRTFAHDGTGDPFSPASIHRIINDTLEFCEARFRSSGVQLQIDSIDPALSIDCRATQITQVLLNLLNNAFDAVSGSQSPWVRVKVESDSNYVSISVTDNGSGIPEAVAEKIMEPFFTTKDVGKGTGLGLSISTGIARSHQGELTLNNRSKNTQFVLRLPKRQGLRRAA